MKFLLFGTFFILCGILLPELAYSQQVLLTTGNWDNSANWQGADIGDAITENVTLDNSRAGFVDNGFSYTIGNLDFLNNAGLTINTTGVLNVGQSGTPKDLTANNNATIAVSGTLIVWGDLIVNNNLSWNITGTVIIKGNVILNNNATLTVSNGTLEVDGNFTGGSNTNVTITGSGSVDVDGQVNVGNSSNLTGPPGSFHAHGCTEGGSSSFCSSGTLPVTLLSFKADLMENAVNLTWSTASELNFDYFIVEKSIDAKTFTEVGSVNGHGTSNVKNTYELRDEQPSHGVSYYRLTEVDLDRSVTHLKLLAVDFHGTKGLDMYPNPVTNGQVTFNLNFAPEGDVDITILDLRGTVLSHFAMSENNITLPVQLGNGAYVVQARSRNFSSTSRLFVR